MKAFTAMLAVALALGLGLSGCGRKNPPKPPMGYVPKPDAVGAPEDKANDKAGSEDGGFKDYRPIRNHSMGNQP
jgi:predicted small lipoprotein YifL